MRSLPFPNLKIVVFLVFELVLLGIMLFLGFKILNVMKGNVKGIQYVTHLDKNTLVFDPNSTLKYFYEPKPNTVIHDKPEWLEYETQYTINSDSLNSLKNYPIGKNSDTFRIVAIGDSFTFGAHVNTSESYPSILEKLLNEKLRCPIYKKFEVINLGMHGYDVEYIGHRFEKRGLKYNPDLVLWLVTPTDFMKVNEYTLPIEEELNKRNVNEIVLPNGEVVLKNKAQAEKEIENKYGMDAIMEYQKDAVFRLAKFYQGKLLVINFSSHPQKIKDLLHEFVKLNPNYSYYEPAFDFWKEKDLQLPDLHPNVKGHRKIAEDILRILLEIYC